MLMVDKKYLVFFKYPDTFIVNLGLKSSKEMMAPKILRD